MDTCRTPETTAPAVCARRQGIGDLLDRTALRAPDELAGEVRVTHTGLVDAEAGR